MRSRIFLGVFLLAGVLSAATTATSRHRVAPARQSAIAYLTEPTMIGLTLVQGPVLFTHDDAKMARGEPCTTVQLVNGGVGFDPANGPVQEVVAFHCIPTPHKIVHKFTLTTQPNAALGFGCVLTGYQFAGDTEVHGVPTPAGEPHLPSFGPRG